jgi:hypothetical protein
MGWVSQATEKVSEAATQALQPIEKGLSQGITDLGRTIADSPALEAVITYIAATNGVPPEATAAFLAANKTSQTGGNLEKGLETLVLSYGAGKLAAYQPVDLTVASADVAAGVPVDSAVAAAMDGGADAVSTLVGGSGTNTALAANPSSMAGQFGFGGASPAASAATQTAATTPLNLANQFGFGNVVAPAAAETGGLLTSGAPSILTAGSAPGALASIGTGYLAGPSAGVLAGASGVGLGSTLAGLGGSPFAPADSVAGDIPGYVSAAGSGLLSGLSAYGPSLVTGGLNLLGASNTAEKAREAAQTQAAAQVEAARIAAEAAKFRPVGVTTRFGASNFQTDAQGNVIGAGYTASPEIQGYQNRLSALAAQGLTGAEGAPAAYAPLTAGAQSLFNLGQGYIQQTPEQQAADYIAKQQALLAPGQEQQLALLQNKLFQQGRGGATIAQGGTMAATSPELAAYYNALAQSNLQLAAQGQQAGMEQARFGAGLLGTGSDLMGKYYGGQTAAYAPFATAIDTTTGLENLAQQPMTLGTQIGARTTASAAQAGQLLSQGMLQSAATQAPANRFSYSGNLFNQAANSPELQDAIRRAFST